MSARILIVEDDPAIRRGLDDALAYAGYAVEVCFRGDQALARVLADPPDLVLLDVLLPRMDGFTVLEELRRSRPQVPVIMLTARGAEEDRVRGLTLGADDYVVKPFSARELLARVAAVLRRSAERPSDLAALDLGDRTIHFDRREVVLAAGPRRPLSDREAEILRYLAINRGRTISRQELLQRVWGCNPHGIASRAVDMHISRLREKLEADPARPRHLLTVRAKGYMLAGEARTP